MSFLLRFIVSNALVIQTNHRDIDKSPFASRPSAVMHMNRNPNPKLKRIMHRTHVYMMLLSATIYVFILWTPFNFLHRIWDLTAEIVSWESVKTVTALGQYFVERNFT